MVRERVFDSSAIRIVRARKGWSQRELAAHSGVSRRTIVRLEHEQTWPQKRKLRKVCDALGLVLEDLRYEDRPVELQGQHQHREA